MNQTFFATNRSQMMEATKGGVVVLAAYTQMQCSNDMAFPFEQEANFWYLTGIEAPNWLVICDGARGKTWLVAPEVSRQTEVFDGSLDWNEAMRISGADEVIAADDADALLRDLARKHSLVYALGDDPNAKHHDFVVNPAGKQLWRRLERIFTETRDCRKELARLRAIKQSEEIKAIKKAVKLTVGAFEAVKEKMAEYTHEYQIEADFSHYFRSRGSAGHAYDPIVASGGNACTLHYTANSAAMRSGQLVLMDIGARVQGYAADITRTYTKGTATKRQLQVHQAVQAAHHDIVGLLEPGLPIEQYLREVDSRMKTALMDIGLLKDMNDTETYRAYFPHAISHGLGIDVHDSLGAPRVFEAGMVLTVEPGIYIPGENIGVRIEDDILITGKGATNLSAGLSTEA